MHKQQKQSGFSLVELMVVVAIIGILSALAIPRFKVFQAKARQAEAKSNLSHIFTLEQSYHGDYDTYVKMDPIGNTVCLDKPNDIGFHLDPCEKARYTYEVKSVDSIAFTATATSGGEKQNEVMPGCAPDEWQINQNKELKANNDVTRTCTK